MKCPFCDYKEVRNILDIELLVAESKRKYKCYQRNTDFITKEIISEVNGKEINNGGNNIPA